MKNDRLDAALDYVRRWEVFPVPPGLKCGYTVESRGFDNGAPWGKTKDADEIRAYWKRLPRANIGIAMGIGSGIFDIECDTVEGHANLKQDGATSLAELEAKHGKLPPTLMFVSPSGSVHRLFRHPGDGFHVEHSISKLGSGIDVIGDGFMSVVPPSRKGKGCYRWLNDLPIAEAPEWLLELVRKPAPVPRTFALSDAELPSREVVILALALLPNDDPKPDWKFWKNTGMAIYASTGGTGKDLWHAWSRRHSHYNAERTNRAWEFEIAKCPPDRYGPRAVINMIEEVMPDWQTAVLNFAYDKRIEAFLKLLDEAA